MAASFAQSFFKEYGFRIEARAGYGDDEGNHDYLIYRDKPRKFELIEQNRPATPVESALWHAAIREYCATERLRREIRRLERKAKGGKR